MIFNTDLSLTFSQIFNKINQLAWDKSRLAFLEMFDGHWFCDVAAHSVVFVRCLKASFRSHSGVHSFGIFMLSSKITIHESFLWIQKKSKEYSPTCLSYIYLISTYTTKFCCLNEHLSFAVNSQKSQFVGIVESRAANVLYPIAEDVAETKNVIIYN